MTARSRKHPSNQTQALTTGTIIRIEEPQSSRHHKTATLVVQEHNPVTGFVGFLREHAVVGLAIGFVIGTQAQSLVTKLVSGFIDPAFQLFFGKALNDRTFTLEFHGRGANFKWGLFAYGLLNFIFVLVAIYALIKVFKLDKLDKPKKEKK